MANIIGTWDYYYDWGNYGNYAKTSITFDNNGTFTTGQGSSGNWTLLDGSIVFIYPNGCTYSGNVCGYAMVGTMNSLGCWYAVHQTITKKAAIASVHVKANGEKA